MYIFTYGLIHLNCSHTNTYLIHDCNQIGKLQAMPKILHDPASYQLDLYALIAHHMVIVPVDMAQ